MSIALSAFLSNSCVQSIVSGIVLDSANKLASKKNPDDVIRKQFHACIRDAYISVCKNNNLEYDLKVIDDYIEKAFVSDKIDDYTQFLTDVSGSDETQIINSDMVDEFSGNLVNNIACYQELNNVCQLLKELNNNNILSDNNEYEENYDKTLFLEKAIDDNREAKLKDLYIQPKYKIDNYNNTDGPKNISELINMYLFCKHDFRNLFDVNNRKTMGIIVTGRPGHGKSSLVSFLSQDLKLKAKLLGRQIIIIKLRNLSETQINNHFYGLLQYIGAGNNSILNNAIIILDGLDEISAAYNGDFRGYLDAILTSVSKIRGAQLIATCRNGYWESTKNYLDKKCLFVNMESWDEEDIKAWGEKYQKQHPSLASTIKKNVEYVIKLENVRKKQVYSVPIIFYLANAHNEDLSKHKSICSIYESVFSQVTEERDYNPGYIPLNDVLNMRLVRQICKEIAFSMFATDFFKEKNENLVLNSEQTDKAIKTAIQICNEHNDYTISDGYKKKIYHLYALTFYYNKNTLNNTDDVEFAHRSIAEFFAAEKIIELLDIFTEDVSEKKCYEALCHACGMFPITIEIMAFIREKLSQKEHQKIANGIKSYLEKNAVSIINDGSIFQEECINIHNLTDKISIITRSILSLLNCVDGHITFSDQSQKKAFLTFINNVACLRPIKQKSPLPLYLDGTDLSNFNFVGCNFSNAHIQKTNLENTRFSCCTLNNARLNDCVLDNATFSKSSMLYAELKGIAKLKNVTFNDSDLTGSIFDKGVKFENVSFDRSILANVKMEQSVFNEHCSLRHTNVYNAKINGADFSKVSLARIITKKNIKSVKGTPSKKIMEAYDLKITRSQMQMLSKKDTDKHIDLKNPHIV